MLVRACVRGGVCMCVHVCVCRVHVCARVCMQARACICVHPCKHMYLHTWAETYIRTGGLRCVASVFVYTHTILRSPLELEIFRLLSLDLLRLLLPLDALLSILPFPA